MKATVGLILTAIIFLLGSYFYSQTGSDVSDIVVGEEQTPQDIWQARMEKKRHAKSSRFDNPDQFALFQRQIRTKERETHPAYDRNYKVSEFNKLKSGLANVASARRNQIEWIERGPANVPGRTRALLIISSDVSGNTWLAGSVGGGIWKTTDAGQNWDNKTPEIPNLAISTLAQSGNVIYAGTGEAFAGDGIDGDGIFKSVDGGENWEQLGSTINKENFGNINRLVVDPSNPNIVIAATEGTAYYSVFSSGILRSTNGGGSWTKVYSAGARVQQIVTTPDNFNILYATVRGTGIIKSINAGLTWTTTGPGMFPIGRIEMAVSPVDPSRLFASAEGRVSGNLSDLYVSDDAGDNWLLATEESNGTNFDFLGGQGNYDNTILAHPYDKDIVYFGGVNLWKATLKENLPAQPAVISVDEINTESFLDLINFGAKYHSGRIDKGSLPDDNLISVEVRFGPGIEQKAHRFTVGIMGAGVPDNGYTYLDYVVVPFQVWDIVNNQQLMVSFRDQNEDGVFNLLEENTDGDPSTHSREYIYIHKEDYADTPHSGIAQNGGSVTGHQYRSMFFFWPVLADGGVWDAGNLPSATFRINMGEIVSKEKLTEIVSDAYSDNGGTNSFSQTVGISTISGLHPDHHGLFVVREDESLKTFRIINTNDGGVYFSKVSADPGVSDGDWIFAGSGYSTSQFYGIDKKPNANEYIGGMQDNGTWKTPQGESSSLTTNYLRQLGGDGFEAVWNAADGQLLIGSSQFNSLRRSINGGKTWMSGGSGLSDTGSGNAPFISKLANESINPSIVYAIGAKGVWKSSDFAATWKVTTINQDFTLRSTSTVKISMANNQIIWAGTGMSSTDKLHVSIDGGESFVSVNNAGASLGVISGLATHPTEDSTAFALFSFAKTAKIYKTVDLGQTWQDISGFNGGASSSTGFPDVAVYSLLVLPHETNTIWAGTEIGIVESKDNGTTWALLDDNFPHTAVWDMKVRDDQVIVGTHGRGIWTATISEILNPSLVPIIDRVGLATSNKISIAANFQLGYDSTIILINGVPTAKLESTNVGNLVITLGNNQPDNEVVGIRLKSYSLGIKYLSNIKTLRLFKVVAPVNSYSNIFNESDDFIGSGFDLVKLTGFNSKSANTRHNHLSNQEVVYQLKVPLIIPSNNASFKYKDIAILEPGAADAVFGEVDFYDFAVVEGSKNGIDWLPIEDGYDANYNSSWLANYNSSGLVTGNLYKEHDIDLLDTFSSGDTVFFRFRMFSNASTVAWGWNFDDLSINNAPLGIKNGSNLDREMSIIAYPNPAVNNNLTISYYLSKPSNNVRIKLVNIEGRLINQFNLGRRASGKGIFTLETNEYNSGIYFLRLETGNGIRTQKIFFE